MLIPKEKGMQDDFKLPWARTEIILIPFLASMLFCAHVAYLVAFQPVAATIAHNTGASEGGE